jgi:serine/threonine protein kinase
MVVEHLAQVADALDHLHEHAPPIVHQDVKPGNLILNAEGRVVLVDFGLSTLGGESTTTRAGTSGYVAPEIAAGEPGAPASDLYGLAATAFTLLTGTAPRGVLPSWGGLPPAVAIRVERAIRRSLSIDPNRRHPRASEFVTELAAARAALDGPRRRSLPRFVRGRSSN